MIKKLVAIVALGIMAVSFSGCCLFETGKDIDVASMERLQKNHKLLLEPYLKYVEADPKLSESEKQTERDLVKATNDLTASILKRLEE